MIAHVIVWAYVFCVPEARIELFVVDCNPLKLGIPFYSSISLRGYPLE